MKHLLSVILILTTATLSAGIPVEVLCDWRYVTFMGKNGTPMTCGGNDTNACGLYDVDKARDGRIFVTAVRDRGVQATLATVPKIMGEGCKNPPLQPYPDWEWNEYDYDTEPDCDKTFISVYRVSIKCNYIFVLDSGNNGEELVCPPKLLIFDLANDKLINRIQIPSNMYNNDSLFVTPLAYIRDCRDIADATVYMADITGFRLVKYNEKSGFCSIKSKYMEPTNTDFIIEDQEFQLDDGILGLATIGKKLYYGVLGGNSMYKMNMCSHDQTCSELTENEANDLTQLAGTLSGQTAAIASKENVIFFSNIPKTSILCQDARKEFHSNNTELIAQDSEKLQFASGMKVNENQLMIFTNRFQKFINNESNPNETNFRILVVDITQVRKETNCFASYKNHGGPGHGRRRYGRPKHGGFGHGYGRYENDKSWYYGLLDWNPRIWEDSNEHNKNSDEHNKNSDEHDEHNKNSDEHDEHNKNSDEHDEHNKNSDEHNEHNKNSDEHDEHNKNSDEHNKNSDEHDEHNKNSDEHDEHNKNSDEHDEHNKQNKHHKHHKHHKHDKDDERDKKCF